VYQKPSPDTSCRIGMNHAESARMEFGDPFCSREHQSQ